MYEATAGIANGKQFRNVIVLAVTTIVWLVIDFLLKQAVEINSFQTSAPIGQIDGVIALQLVHNRGIAFGAFSGAVGIVIAITSVVIIAIAILAAFETNTAPVWEMVGFGLVLAGGIGNLIDRIVYGYVIDMFKPLFIDFPTFNLADVGITVGFVIVIVGLLRHVYRLGRGLD